MRIYYLKGDFYYEGMRKMDKKKIFEKVNSQFKQQMNVKYGFKEKKRINQLGFNNLKKIVDEISPTYVLEMFYFEEAKKAYLASLPEDETVEFMNLTKLLHNVKNDNLKTIEDLKENYILSEENYDLYLQYFGDICRCCDEYEMAEKIYGFQLEQNLTDGFIGFGLLNKKICEYSEAEKCFMYGHKIGNKKAAYNLGCLYYEVGQTESAEYWFKTAIKENADIDALAELGCLCQNSGKVKKSSQLKKIAEKLMFKEDELTITEEIIWNKMRET